MGHIKTAISLEEDLFKQMEDIGRELNLSRSRLVASALEEFIQRRQNKTLLARINEAHDESSDDSERRYLRHMRRRHRKLVEDQW